MAIDTAEKRRSAIDFGKYCGTGMPIPMGSIQEASRAHILNLYSGVLPNASSIIFFWRGRGRIRRLSGMAP